MAKPKGKKYKKRVPWADHVLKGQHRRTVAKPMKLKSRVKA